MDDSGGGELLERLAPTDVRDAIAWLSATGYSLESCCGEGSFGAQFVYVGAVTVIVTVDRSQWMLEIALRPDAEPWQYDLLVAAHAGQSYAEVFPRALLLRAGERLPEQLPDGVSWRATLPDILAWVQTDGVRQLVDRARRERSQLPRKAQTDANHRPGTSIRPAPLA